MSTNPAREGLPEADAVEQSLPVIDDNDEPAPAPQPLESDPADVHEQHQIVVTDDEEYPR
ncbi:hypothetical protein BJY16_007449 [Actinoplanes octamycinicus]|uniref:Uncharacterized protein n=1 Tax=Actinoplanes octamycinicus TaxID=135948 RepID=A0A7W7H4Q8_9ACTN|nr:hypothetical protein [Actinoplanes octamycinicus]MBB4743990.1 hypothetical protein [Actinoplanes octamycinicus]GIE58614.1 hypothetical protein Aoc01nite_40160 [Actinoplanes octamycinicus]